ESFGIKHGSSSITVTRTRDTKYSDSTLYWTSPCVTKSIETIGENYTILCTDQTTRLPLAVSGAHGKGKFIYYGPLFDPVTNKGYTRFPFLIEALYDFFGYHPIVERQAAEMYFDPGNRSNDTLSADDLAKLWRKEKIKKILAAGWYYDTDYDYKGLLKACHENGIQVLCWLEPPMISTKFWNNHPEWREKTVFQQDAHIDWRYLINLADSNCRKQVFAEAEKFLMNTDFDGVDFAELYFEPTPVGPELPENFTPMNSIVRDEFKKVGGFDPVLLFDTTSEHYWKNNQADWKKFANYRKELLYRLKKDYLTFLSSVKSRKKDYEIMLTVLDVSITPYLSDYIGEDTENFLKLYHMFDITLQVEDPSSCWGLTPERYDRMGQLYRKTVKGKNRLLFDCNVVSAHELGYGGFPSDIPTGEELRQIAYNMDLHSVRPAFYSEDVVSANDYRNISTVLGNKAKISAVSATEWKIKTPETVTVNTGNPDVNIRMDHQTWCGGDGEMIIVPQGEHSISFSAMAKDTGCIQLKNISGELLSAKFLGDALEFIYSEDISPCYVILNRKPSTIYIDNQKSSCTIFPNDEDEFVLKLPEGKHSVRIEGK
ncbi:MAG TPA: hypothetical protein VIH57_01165, partial [Bacteroidales bacterium]